MAVRNVIIIGAGMGGLTAALRLARAGLAVRVIEARPGPGGLAAGFELDGLRFDAGPYILLDRPGMEWAFQAVGLELGQHVPLKRVEDIYEVLNPDGTRVRFQANLDATAAEFERQWPGSGPSYVRHVTAIAQIYRRLEPLQRISRPGLWDLIRSGGWRHLFFLLRSLDGVLARTGLPQPVRDALAIWTHIAGQRVEQAPSPLAFVPALLHGVGAFYPLGGIGLIPASLAAAAQRAGVVFDYGVTVTAIRRREGRAAVVETDRGEVHSADAILSNAAGIGTYLDLLESPPPTLKTRLEPLALQSPGVAAYLAVKGPLLPPYLRFYLPGGEERCRCLVMPAVIEPGEQKDGWYPARLIVPMDYARAQAVGPGGQREYLERILAEPWWREHLHEYRVLATRIPAEWGSQFNLYRDSMNPVMTAQFMRAGRLAHRSADVPGLFLAGSATHPGQWVSFCAISGVLAADKLLEDFR
jgi:phytoene dehydrogenase-like protein